MSHGQGRVYRPKVNGTVVQVWWLDYSHRGKRHRESSGTTNKTEALKMLRARATARDAGKLIGNPDRVRLVEYAETAGKREISGGLLGLVVQQYKSKGNRSLKRMLQGAAHLVNYFGESARAPDVTTATVWAYESKRRETVSKSTVNYEKAIIRQAFRLAVKAGQLATVPTIETPKIKDNIREASFSNGELAALLLELSPLLRPLVLFLYLTAWREREGRLLTWEKVDWEAGVIRLSRARSKSGEPREFPFAAVTDLKALMEAQQQQRNGLYVFHDGGEPIGYGKLRSGWKRALKRAGLEGRHVHDLRRAGADNMRQHDIAETDVMEMCGWDTPEMFRRYRIENRKALAKAAAKLNTPHPVEAP
jgi:integrase